MKKPFSIRPAAFVPGRSGRPILQEIYSFAERAGIADQEAGVFSEVGPLSLLGTERLIQCDEAFVAEQDARIVGAVTLAFSGVFDPKMPTLDALYVLPECHRQGIGFALLEQAVRRFMELGKVPIFCRVTSEEMQSLLKALGKRLPELLARIKAVDDF
jgi:GNAT superfamily N-acetyltransferase